MKSQTKALLASVMVLALALSSIGGVTYSWFSDIQTGNIQVSTAILDVSTTVDATGNVAVSGEDGDNIRDLTITPNGTANVAISGTNNSPFPVDISIKITHTKQCVILPDKTVDVSFERDASGNINLNSTPQEVYWYTSYTNFLFGSGESKETLSFDKATYPMYKINEDYFYYSGTTDQGNSYSKVKLMHYYHTVEKTTIKSGGSFNSNVLITIGQGFNPDIIDDVKIIIEVTQSSSFIQNINESGQGIIELTDIIKQRSVLFIGNGITVHISKEAIQDANRIEISYTNINNTQTINLKYDNGITIPDSGKVTIIFDSQGGNLFGSMTSSASNTTFTFTTDTGESS